MSTHWPLILKSALRWLTSYLGISLRGGIDEVKQAEALSLAFPTVYIPSYRSSHTVCESQFESEPESSPCM